MRPTARLILILILVPSIACLLGYGVGAAVQAAPVQWTSLGSPPKPAVRLLGVRQSGSTFSIFAQSASGEVFASSTRQSGLWTNDSSQTTYHSRACGSVEPPFLVPAQPVDVTDCIEFDPGFEATSFDIRRYVLASDGSVWTWQKEQRIISQGVSYAAIGFAVGLFAAIIVIFLSSPKLPNRMP